MLKKFLALIKRVFMLVGVWVTGETILGSESQLSIKSLMLAYVFGFFVALASFVTFSQRKHE